MRLVLPCLLAVGCSSGLRPAASDAGVPTLEVTPAEVKFGDVSVGAVASDRMTLRAIGTKKVVINDLWLAQSSDPAFTLAEAPTPWLLNPSQSYRTELSFAPSEVGPHTGTVVATIMVSGEASEIELPLTGTGCTNCGGR